MKVLSTKLFQLKNYKKLIKIFIDERLLLLFLYIPLIIKFYFIDIASTGNDTQTHIFKVKVLLTQISSMEFFNVGIWDWSWYNGYPILHTYPPLFYWLTTALSIFFQISAEVSASIVIFFSFIISGIGMFLLIKYLVKDKWVVIGCTAFYLYMPHLIVLYFENGNVTQLLALAFAPFALYFGEKYINTKDMKYFLFSTISLTCVIISNHGVGAVLAIAYLLWYALRKQFMFGLMIFLFSLLLSTFFIIPYLLSETTHLPVMAHDFPIGLLPLFASLIFVSLLLLEKFIEKNTLKIEKIKKYMRTKYGKEVIVTAFILLAVLGYNGITYLSASPLLAIIAYTRTLPIVTIFLPILFSFLLVIFLKNKKIRAIFFISLIIFGVVESMQIRPYTPVQKERYALIADEIRKDESWCRYILIPAEPVGTILPKDTEKPTLLGWYHEGIHPELFKYIGAGLIVVSYAYLEQKFIEGNATEQILILKFFGVKYLIVDDADPVYPKMASQIYTRIKDLDVIEEIFSYNSIHLFQIKNFTPIHVYATPPLTIEEAIYNCTGIENFILHSIKNTEQALSILIEVKQPLYVVIPVTNSPILRIKLNENLINAETTVGAQIMLFLSEPGKYYIEISPQIPPTTIISYGVSIIVFGFLVIIALAPRIKSIRYRLAKNEKKIERQRKFCS